MTKILATRQTRYNERYITIQNDEFGAITTYTQRQIKQPALVNGQCELIWQNAN